MSSHKKKTVKDAHQAVQDIILQGGQSLEVNYLSGKTETVAVSLLPVKQSIMGDFMLLVDDDYKLADWICKKPEGWSESLHPESVLNITEKALDLNFTTAVRFSKRRLEVTGKLFDPNDPMQQRMLETIAERITGRMSQNSASSAEPSSAAAQ